MKNYFNWPSCSISIAASISMLSGVPATAAEPAFKKSAFELSADRMAVAEVLRTFALAQGWQIAVSPAVEGTVSARFNMTPQVFWRMLISSGNLHWYYDGQVMHVGTAGELRTEVMNMPQEAFARLSGMVDRLGIADARYPIKYDSATRAAMLTAPPKLADTVNNLLRQMDVDGSTRELAMELVTLKNAVAADSVIRYGNSDMRVEGVANVVRRIMGLENSAYSTAPASRPSTHAERMIREAGQDPAPVAVRLSSQVKPSGQEAAANTASTLSTPRFNSHPQNDSVEADEVTNTVVVRAAPSRLRSYVDLIRRLDQPRQMLEIEAQMIDIEQSQLEELGVDWKLNTRNASVDVVNTPVGGVAAPQYMSALVGGTLNNFFARIKALESRGEASIITQPKLLTLNNAEAMIENTETAYIKVSGNLEANLFSVVTGSTLQVRPSILAQTDPIRIRLSLMIEDGVFSETKVDSVPIVRRSRMFSQSELADGATLVVGGMSTDKRQDTNGGVPWLSKVPGLGALFSASSQNRNRRVRLYALTPKVVRTLVPGGADVYAIEGKPSVAVTPGSAELSGSNPPVRPNAALSAEPAAVDKLPEWARSTR
jgi:type III secretion protein C